MTVLVVVANPALRAELTTWLNQRGCRVRAVLALEHAVEMLAQEPSAVVLAEAPEADDRSNMLQRLPSPPVPARIVFVGERTEQHMLDALRAGALDYLPTPVSQPELDAALSRWKRALAAFGQYAQHAYDRGAEEQRSALAAQVQSESLALMSRLAANLAHEINNPLTPIVGLAELLADESAPGSTNHTIAQTIVTSARRIAATVQSLMGFTRPLATHDAVDLRVLVAEALQSVQQRLVDQRIALTLDMPNEPAIATVSVAEIKQMLFVLLDHARLAMPEGGQLTIRLGRESGDAEAPAMVLEVQDTAPPIATYHLPNLFEPFYTPSALGVGTGLGLSIARRIAELHGGQITVDVGQTKGNIFRVTLPVS